MSKFNLTAQIQLQAPKNAPQVVQQIQRQLSGVNVNLNIQNGPQATRQVNNLTKATNQAASAADRLGKGITGSIKRYAGMAIATRAVSLFTNTLGGAIQEAIDFERELIKVVQVTGRSIQSLRGLTNEITRLSTAFGASSTSLINVTRILSQAGLSANETKTALDALARSTLAPTFDDIASTAEGAVAIFNQFQQGAAALEKQLGAINAVAGRFAVEAGDLIAVIRRTGGVFKAAGGDLNELIALFTSVRATTRESAESIATGLRTIFTRIQRPKTIEFLRQFGVELTDLEGKFVGPFEATRRLSEALAGLEQGDLQFISIAEELGGFRQIGKVIPLIQQFQVSQEALNTAIKGGDSLTKDAATAQQALAVRISKVKEEFLALVRAISESKSFQLFANTALNIASALIKVADALKPLIPLIGAFAGIKLAGGIAGALGGLRGGTRGFASGGIVPGSGNRDTVPAMLTPGEFVIRKSSVAKLGADNLAAMNKYANGGGVYKAKKSYGMLIPQMGDGEDSRGSYMAADGNQYIADLEISGFKKGATFNKEEKKLERQVDRIAATLGKTINTKLDSDSIRTARELTAASGGKLFEAYVTSAAKLPDPKNNRFDIPKANRALRSLTDEPIPTTSDIKRSNSRENRKSMVEKILGTFGKTAFRKQRGQTAERRGRPRKQLAAGGPAGTDTIPALLTPGEFVVNRASAQKIGYGALNRMNKVGKYASGGIVQKFNKGTGSTGAQPATGNLPFLDTFSGKMMIATGALSSFIPAVDETSSATVRVFRNLMTLATTLAATGTALEAFGFKITLTAMSDFFRGGTNFAKPISKAFNALTNRMGNFGRALQATTQAGSRGFLSSARATSGTGIKGFFKKGFAGVGGGVKAARGAATTVAARGATGALASAGGAIGSIVGPAAGALAAVLGPLVAIVGGLAIVSTIVDGFRDLDGRLKEAIKANDTDTAQTLAQSKANADAIPLIGGLVSGFADLIGKGDSLSNFLVRYGGNTVASQKAAIEAQIDGQKATKALINSEKAATDALADFKNGTLSATEALDKVVAAQAPVNAALASSVKFAQENRNNRSTGGSAIARNIFTIGGLLGETAGQRNRRLGGEGAESLRSATAQDAQSFQQQSVFRAAVIRSTVRRGGDAQAVLNARGLGSANARSDQATALRQAIEADLAGDTEGAEALRERARMFEEQAKLIEKEIKNITESAKRHAAAIDAMNLSMESVNATANAAAVGLDNFLARQTLGNNPLEASLATLEASITSAAMGISEADMDAALGDVSAQIEALGGDASKLQQNVKAVQIAQKTLPDTIKKMQDEFNDAADRGLFEGMGATEQKARAAKIIGDSLVGVAGIGKDARERIVAQIEGMDLNDEQLAKIMEGDMSAISDVLEEIGENALKQVLPALRKQVEIQNKLNALTQKRIELENQYINAQKKTIETQLEVAEIIARNGGPAVTNAQRIASLNAQGNVDSNAIGGISGLTTGGPAESRRRAEESRARLQEIQATRRRLAEGQEVAGTSNEAGLELAEQERRLLAFQQSEADRIRKTIALREAEIKIIQARNAEEKKGLEALLQGDFEQFFDSQAAVGATAALATGNQELINAFGPSGLAGAFENLQNMNQQGVGSIFGQNIGGTGGLLEQSAAAALSPFGLQGQAQTLAGTDPEIQALQQLNREEAAVLNQLAQTTENAAQASLQAANIQMAAARAQLKAAGEEVDEAMGKARGGMVYANRGMFVPRGTDTVPAMLTPGEFVVRRSAVQRGNNLSLLKAINTGATAAPGATQSLSRGGSVQYLANGGEAGGAGLGLNAEAMSNFASALNTFNTQLAQNIQNLQSTQFQITLNPTNINVNLTGTSFLEKLTSTLKQELFNFVGQEIQSYTVGSNGKLTKDSMGV